MRVPKKLFVWLILSISVLSLFGYAAFRYIQHWEYVKATPYDVLISDVSSDSVTVSWKTDVNTPSYIKIGESEKLYGNDTLTNSHRVTLGGLNELSKYNFLISDSEKEWNTSKESSTDDISVFALNEFSFQTLKSKDEILLPLVEEIDALPNELIYVALYNTKTREYSDVRSEYANRFGGVVIDKEEFNVEWDKESTQLKKIEYFTPTSNLSMNPLSVTAAEINCNQNVSAQSFDGVSKEKFEELASRWVANRGKNYAQECYNDVILRAKREGVDPAFALTIWLNESGASNYTQNSDISGIVEDFGIHGQASAPPQDFNAQITYFLKLKHTYTCPELSAWEAWGNMYRWGSCNENDAVKRQVGIDYYKGIEMVYGWVTNGRKLPSQVTGLPKSGGGDDDGGGGWEKPSGPLCCALKIDNQEQFQGDYENNAEGKSCSDIWKSGRSIYDGKLEYSVEIKGKVESACEVKYEAVCCEVGNDVMWYPKSVCTKVVPDITTSQACKEYANDKGCFFREGIYQWLPKSVGKDFDESVTTQSQCESRNKLSTYKIELQKGVNFVGFDFEPTYKATGMHASNLIETNSSILLIANFEGYEWKDIVKKSETVPFAGNDFVFKQNKGYLIISSEDTVLNIDGWKDSASKYLPLSEGWNLVGGSLYSKSYKASTLISNLKKSDIDVDVVAVWSKELGLFNYRREEEDSTVYGDDLKLESNQGIFLKK